MVIPVDRSTASSVSAAMLAESVPYRHVIAAWLAGVAVVVASDRGSPAPEPAAWECVDEATPATATVPVAPSAPPVVRARRVVVASPVRSDAVVARCASTNKPEITVAFADAMADSATLRVQVACSAFVPVDSARMWYRLELTPMVEDLDGKNDTLWHADRVEVVGDHPVLVMFE
jgi:hypothetical protein